MITLFGAPGAGKTIQGQLLARKYGWEWVSYRDLLMSLRDKDIRYALDHGLFIDDKKAAEVVMKTLRSLRGLRRQIVLDGFQIGRASCRERV